MMAHPSSSLPSFSLHPRCTKAQLHTALVSAKGFMEDRNYVEEGRKAALEDRKAAEQGRKAAEKGRKAAETTLVEVSL